MIELSKTQTDALREISLGPMRLFPNNRWSRSRYGPFFAGQTVKSLVRGGYVHSTDMLARLTPAGLDVARLRGFMPQLAKLECGDSHSRAKE
ncbi:hypothetical protein BA190_26745 [Labrys sp. WJW]|uniref:hypothetical protein n=1 Tax=Labrys sp. WJW TaxID=1737983 RepID=UPI00082B3D42|nr:hypothetical protein [Labrys sp. WJW]OCC01814.1 hypothetical protein BA190_26745 [Labrys sp. WJW]